MCVDYEPSRQTAGYLESNRLERVQVYSKLELKIIKDTNCGKNRRERHKVSLASSQWMTESTRQLHSLYRQAVVLELRKLRDLFASDVSHRYFSSSFEKHYEGHKLIENAYIYNFLCGQPQGLSQV